MNRFQGLHEEPLHVERSDDDRGIVLTFSGKSILRDPTGMLQNGLQQAREEADAEGIGLVLDFRNLDYMNSATFTPVIKILEKARLGRTRLTVLYNQTKRWQTVSFAALAIFETADGRIVVRGES